MRYRLLEVYDDGTTAPITINKNGLTHSESEVDTKLLETVYFDTKGSREVGIKMIGDNYVEVTLR